MRRILVAAVLSIQLIAHSQGNSQSVSSLKFIGQYEIPFNQMFKNTVVGGLSGIDYDVDHDVYYLISDDRSVKNDARFYTAKIYLSNKTLDSVRLLDVKTLLQPDGKPYPSTNRNAALTPDPESIRYNSKSVDLVWASEGERALKKDTVLQNPAIHTISLDGKYKSSYTLPANLTMQTSATGPRQNGTLEGLSFSNDFALLYACLEEPLFQDGPKAEINETNSFVRIYKFNTQQKACVQQFAYKLEKVAYPSTPSNAFSVNGVSDILYLTAEKILVIERSFSTGRLPCTVKIFLADLSGAEDVTFISSLAKTPAPKAAAKKLLLNMDELGIFIDNIEGVTFGPTLPNGHKTLLFVADNNFQPFEKNQFLLFEVLP